MSRLSAAERRQQNVGSRASAAARGQGRACRRCDYFHKYTYSTGAGPSRKGRFAALFLENRPRKNLLFLLFRPLLLFFKGLFRVEIYKLEQNRADQLFYR